MHLDLGSVSGLLAGLNAKVEDAARPAAQAGAQVIYDQVRINVGAIGHKTGNLSRSIYQVFSKDHSSQGAATYHISWNARKAPHGHLVEFGHIQKYKVYMGKDGKWHTNKRAPIAPKHVAARPFLRPALDRSEDALRAAQARLLEEIGA